MKQVANPVVFHYQANKALCQDMFIHFIFRILHKNANIFPVEYLLSRCHEVRCIYRKPDPSLQVRLMMRFRKTSGAYFCSFLKSGLNASSRTVSFVLFFTGQGFTCQISPAYSWMVLSEENFPEAAMLRMAFLLKRSKSSL